MVAATDDPEVNRAVHADAESAGVWVNSADDFINPPEYGIAEAAARRMPTARYVLIPRSADTRGHGTHTWARFWKGHLIELLRRTE